MSTTNANQSIYYLYGFNSYSDRRCIKYDTLQEYLALTTIEYDVQAATNFCEGDGVVRGKVTYRKGLGMPTGTPNYAIVADSLGTIQSRWYVVDSLNKNVSTYELVLKRDSVADFYDDVIKAPTFIEKATLNINNPFIFNPEDMQFNQIKTSETLLKDATASPWIIGFMANKQPEGTSEPFTTTINTAIIGQPDATYNSMADYPYWNYFGLPPTGGYKYFDSNKGRISVWLKMSNTKNLIINYTYNSLGLSYEEGDYDFSGDGITAYTNCRYQLGASWLTYANGNYNISTIANAIKNEINTNAFLQNLESHTMSYSGAHTNAQGQQCRAENGKIIKTNASATNPNDGITYAADTYSVDIHDNTYFTLYGDTDNNAVCTGSVPVGSNLNSYIVEVLDDLAQYSGGNLTINGSYMNMTMCARGGRVCTFELQSTTVSTISFALNASARSLIDAPYRMFAMPYNDNIIKWKKNNNYYISNKNYNMSIAQGITSTFSGTWLYDLQLVPYCPFIKSDIISNVNNEVIIDISNLTENTDYQIIGSDTGVIFWCQTSQIDNYIINYNIPTASTAVEKKVNILCDMYRLSSPSYNSIFEFNVEKNGGVNYFDIDLVYKPYDSYIHINPNFGMLYGDDFNDARGLVFTGPFSLPQTTSTWQQYKLNNMNYQNSFDRQIENMETMHEIEMKERKWKAGSGAFTGLASGAAVGAMAGGLPGAIAGGVIGGIASTVGGVLDVKNAEKRFDETIDYTIDQFNMNLQNIKAQAQTLSKVSAFTPNNKVFPILEYYTCTTVEKEALRNKVYYNGMSVGVIGQIEDYLQSSESYIKGQVIRLTINEENHMVEDIKNEIYKGVFIK